LSESSGTSRPTILHVSTRSSLSSIRDQILRVAGYEVISCPEYEPAGLARIVPVDLILIDVANERQVHEAEHLCSTLKSHDPAKRVAFVCNWQVAFTSDCPDEIVRSEFDPAAFVNGIAGLLQPPE